MSKLIHNKNVYRNEINGGPPPGAGIQGAAPLGGGWKGAEHPPQKFLLKVGWGSPKLWPEKNFCGNLVFGGSDEILLIFVFHEFQCCHFILFWKYYHYVYAAHLFAFLGSTNMHGFRSLWLILKSLEVKISPHWISGIFANILLSTWLTDMIFTLVIN